MIIDQGEALRFNEQLRQIGGGSHTGVSAFNMLKKRPPYLETAYEYEMLFHYLLHRVKYFCIL